MSQVDICNELAQNFIDFSYEANSCRGFADARDGLKPGQRACLWEMYNSGYTSKKPHVKSAKISGSVIANWWPHSNTAIYETFARMSQDWINNIPEVDWHGNNGTQIISAEPASERYTEARLAKIVEDGMFDGIKKNKVNMIPNFSEDAEWPEVLPAIFPRLLVNGCQGIGVTIANTWLPTPFSEAAAVLLKYIDTNEVDTSLIAPSFPSGGVIINKDDVSKIYSTGKGKVILRGKATVKGNSIFITEMPYQVYVEPYIEEVKQLINDGTIPEIEEIFNRSDKNGLCIEIICESDAEVVLNKLFDKTSLQSNYNANQWALVGKTPRLLTLRDYCEIYVAHNSECIKREIEYDLDKTRAKLHIVEGLLIALDDIENVIKIIRTTESPKTQLMGQYGLSEAQAQAILDMKLSRLSKLERSKLENEKKELLKRIEELNDILNNILAELKKRLQALLDKYGDQRRTTLTQIKVTKEKKKGDEPPQACVIQVTNNALIKRVRGGAGMAATTHDSLLLITSGGNGYRLKVKDIAEGRNEALRTLVPSIPEDEEILFCGLIEPYKNMVFVTKGGMVKKSKMDDLDIKRSGSKVIKLKEEDKVVAVKVIDDELEDAVLVTKNDLKLRFPLAEIPITGRTTQGVKGILLGETDEVIGLRTMSADSLEVPAANHRARKGVKA